MTLSCPCRVPHDFMSCVTTRIMCTAGLCDTCSRSIHKYILHVHFTIVFTYQYSLLKSMFADYETQTDMQPAFCRWLRSNCPISRSHAILHKWCSRGTLDADKEEKEGPDGTMCTRRFSKKYLHYKVWIGVIWYIHCRNIYILTAFMSRSKYRYYTKKK